MSEKKNYIFAEEDKYGIGSQLDDFEYLQFLGGGNKYHFAKVKSKLNNKIYVMKIISNIDTNSTSYKNLQKNLFIIRLLDHPNVIKYYSSFLENNNYHIIIEFAENGNLKNFIKIHKILNKHIDAGKLNQIFYESMSGLYYLHNNNILHQNISPSSLFISKDAKIKIGGLENIRVNNKEIDLNLFSKNLVYDHPNLKGYESDIYSLGSVFFHLRHLAPEKIILPPRGELQELIYEKLNEGNEIDNKDSEFNMIVIGKDNKIDINKVYEGIKKNYFKLDGPNSNSSINAVYFCFKYLLEHKEMQFDDGSIVLKRRIKLSEINKEGPISKSLSIADLQKIRDILIQSNKAFNKVGEINPHELIKFLIKQIHLENNNNIICSKIFVKETSPAAYSKEDSLRVYYDYYQKHFKSILSTKEKGFFGTFIIEDKCNNKNCNKIRYYFESFYYITIDLDAAKGEVSIFGLFGANKEIFITNKYCQSCKQTTEHQETKSIYEYPNRLVLLIKNNNKENKLKNSKILNAKIIGSNNLNASINYESRSYLLTSTIYYNEKKNQYEYSYFIKKESSQIFLHSDGQKNASITNNSLINNFIALMYLCQDENN